MGYSKSIRFLPETLRSLGFASIGAAYMGVGTAIDHPARMVIIQNYTNDQLLFSFDGVNDHITLSSLSQIVLDISSNKTTDDGFYMAEGDRLYVKEVVGPTSGSVYFSVFYGKD